jgi:hypothetical protein
VGAMLTVRIVQLVPRLIGDCTIQNYQKRNRVFTKKLGFVV